MPDARDAAPAEDAPPRYTCRPLPLARHLPGRTPRPRAPEAAPRGAAASFDPAAWWSCEDFLHGVDLWNRRFFWEAHEAWEAPWREAGRDTEVGRVLQGLILLAAAALKHELGAGGPARRLAVRGARLLREARAPRIGFDGPALASATRAWIEGARAAPPVLRLAAVERP